MKFSEIIGQKTAKNILMKAAKGGRLPHALLFSGISGTGKKTMAKALAMYLNCEDPDDDGGCGGCKYCRQIISGNFPDFWIIKTEDPKQKISIEYIREIIRRTSFSPLRNYRIFVIDEAEKLTEEAGNAFLKILEEPPERNIFILNVVEQLNLLPTVVSRCQKIPFYPIPRSEMVKWLVKNRSVDTDTASVLSKISGGSLGRAIKLLERDFFGKREEWIMSIIKLPSFEREEVFGLINKYMEMDLEDIKDMFTVWQSWLRDMVVIKEGGKKEDMINSDLSRLAEKVAERYSLKTLTDSIMLIYAAEQDIQRNRNLFLLLERLVFQLWKLLKDYRCS